MSHFIDQLSIEFVNVIDSNENKNNSFYYLPKFSHRATLQNLYSVLISEGLMGKETKELHFVNLFKNKEVDNLVRWTGQTSELKYFIELINREDFGFENKGHFKWRIAAKCFVKVSSRDLKKITYKDLRTYKITPNTKQKLDDVLVAKILKI